MIIVERRRESARGEERGGVGRLDNMQQHDGGLDNGNTAQNAHRPQLSSDIEQISAVHLFSRLPTAHGSPYLRRVAHCPLLTNNLTLCLVSLVCSPDIPHAHRKDDRSLTLPGIALVHRCTTTRFILCPVLTPASLVPRCPKPWPSPISSRVPAVE